MKKFLSVLTVIMLIVCMVGCSSNTGKIADEEIESKDVQQTMTEKNNSLTDEGSPIYTVEEFQKNIKAYVNLSNYESPETEPGSHCYYSLKKDLRNEYNLDHVINLDNNTKIAMPMPFKDLEKQGWQLSKSSDAQIELNPGVTTAALCRYNEQQITVESANTTDKPSVYENGTIHRVLFDLYGSNDNFENELDTAPQFTVCGNINNDSDIEDIIATLGEPTHILYSIIGEYYAKIELQYNNSNAYDSIDFILTSNGSKIISIDYNAYPFN